MENLKIFQVEKPWGNFRQFTLNSPSTVKIISVKAGEELSLQSHSKRAEFWCIVRGSGTVQIGEKKYSAIAGEEYEILAGEKHRISAGLDGVEFLEIATGDFDENDIVRYEDKYGRV